MAKTITATKQDIDTHQSLTRALQLQDVVVVGQEFHELTQTMLILCQPHTHQAKSTCLFLLTILPDL